MKEKLKYNVTKINLTHASGLQMNILNNTILGIYRSPSSYNADYFINSLSRHLATLTSGNNIIIASDINININPVDQRQPYDLKYRTSNLNMLSAYGILPGHTSTIPTRKRKISPLRYIENK